MGFSHDNFSLGKCSKASGGVILRVSLFVFALQNKHVTTTID